MHPALLPLARDNAGHLPREAMQWALDHWEEVGTELLDRLDAYPQDSDPSDAATNIAFFVTYLAAHMRDRRAFPILCRLAEHAEALDTVLGDGITEDLKNILISTYDGDLARLQALIECAHAEDYARGEGFDVLVWLTATGALPAEQTHAYLRGLHATMQPQQDHPVWFGWQQAIALLGYEDLRPLVADAFAREFIGPDIMDIEDFEEDLQASRAAEDRIAFLASRRIAPLGDVITLMAGWYGFSEAAREERRRQEERERARLTAPTPAVNPHRHIGRNDPCPCGSGKKYKKCCLPAA